ncbi:MAG: hypothetical protein V1774_01530 [Candidatus Eisenbacteria bacterium]
MPPTGRRRLAPAARRLRTILRIPAVIALLGGLLCAAAPWMTGPWAVLRIFALCVAPGLALLLLLAPETLRPPARATAVTLLGSAVISPGLLFLAGCWTGGLERALPAACIAWGVFFAATWLWRSRSARTPDAADGQTRQSRGWLVIAGGALLLGLPLLINPDLRVRSDAWTHIALVRTILDGPYPWNDPRFAGQPLRYFWMYDYWAAAFAARGGLPHPWALVMVQLAAITAFVAAIAALVGHLFRERVQRIAAYGVVALGLNPLGFLGIATHLGRALTGTMRGTEYVGLAAEKLHFWDAHVHRTLAPYPSVPVVWLSKFFVITPFGLGMAGAVVALLAILETYRERRATRARLIMLGLSFLAVCLHHLVAAAIIGIALGGALLIAPLLKRPALKRTTTWGLVAAMAGAAMLSLPYLIDILSGRDALIGSHDGYALGIESSWVLTAIIVLGPLAALLFIGRRRIRETLGPASPWAGVICLIGAALLLFARLPTSNEDKIFILLFCLAAPFGGAGALALHRAAWPRRVGRVVWSVVLLSAILGPALLWLGHVAHSERPVAPGRQAAAAWLREESPADAVVIEPLGMQFLLNRAEREMLVSEPNFVVECGYPLQAMRERSALVKSLYTTGRLADDQRALLRELGRPIFAFYAPPPQGEGFDRPGDAARAPNVPAPSRGQFRRIFRNQDAAIYEFIGNRSE